MNNKRIKGIMTGTLIALTLSFVTVGTEAFASETTIAYKDAYGETCVNILELTKALNGEVKRDVDTVKGVWDTSLQVVLNGKSLLIYPQGGFMYINGQTVPFRTESAVDSISGIEFNFPVKEKPVADGEGFLVPVKVLEEYFGIKSSDNGIVIESDDSGTSGGSQTGGNTVGNNNSGGSGNNGSGNKPAQPKPTPPVVNPTPDTSKPPIPPTLTPLPKPETPKPPVTPPPVQTGLTPLQVEERLPGFGMKFDPDSSGYGIRVYSSNEVVIAIDEGLVEIGFTPNIATEASILKSILNMILPTAGDEIYNKVTSPFGDQTLQRDGRSVELWNAYIPTVTIRY